MTWKMHQFAADYWIARTLCGRFELSKTITRGWVGTIFPEDEPVGYEILEHEPDVHAAQRFCEFVARAYSWA